MNKNTGGPAFPVIETYLWQGMTLRDHFAGLAMQGLIVNNGGLSAPVASLLSTIAYCYADSMLAEREKGNGK